MEKRHEEYFQQRGWSYREGPDWCLIAPDDTEFMREETDSFLEWVNDRVRRWKDTDSGRGDRNCVVQAPTGTDHWFLKQYHHGGLLAGQEDVVYSDYSRFVDELRATLMARESGVKTPEPLCLLVRSTDQGYEGFYVSKYVEESRLLSKVLRNSENQSFLVDAGETLALLHDVGLDHRDFHVENLIVNDEGDLVVTDFDPVSFGPLSSFRRDIRVRRFNRSLGKYGFPAADTSVFKDAYYGSADTEESLSSQFIAPFQGLSNSISDFIYWTQDRELKPINLEKVLIRAPNWLGDTVMSLPLIERMNESEAVGDIDVAVRSSIADLYHAHEAIGTVRELPDEKSFTLPESISGERYSSIVVIPKSFRTGYQAFQSGIPRRIGFATQGRSLFLTDRVPLRNRDRSEHHARLYMRLLEDLLEIPDRIPSPDLSAPDSVLESIDRKTPESFFTIHPGSAYGPAKRWPADQFSDLLSRLLQERDESIVALGVEEERSLAETILDEVDSDRIINCVGETTLHEAMAYLQTSNGTVANDSGIMHLSAALDTPTIGIFGSSDPGLTRPLGTHCTYVYEGVDCSPCFETHCPLSENRYKCLEKISANRVFETFNSILEVDS
ncbi:MAG: lipopolysaccharide heptosyltransferase II [bacterium]